MNTAELTGLFKAPGEGEAISTVDIAGTIKLTGADTNQVYAVIEGSVPPHAAHIPLHTDSNDANFYIVEGVMTFQLGTQLVEAHPGSFVHIPKGLPHTRGNLSNKPAKMLGFVFPAGQEIYLRDMSDLVATMPPGQPDMKKLVELSIRHGQKVMGPPLSQRWNT
jgi:quercetin dioxygenase-like cupin family protein